MKTLQEIEADVAALARRIGASSEAVPTYGTSDDGARPHIEVGGGSYHYIVVERGVERDRRSSGEYRDLLYWIFADITFGLAFSYELANRIKDQDCRRIAFPKQIALMQKISPDLAERLERDIAEILRRAPYDDGPTKAVNHRRRSRDC